MITAVDSNVFIGLWNEEDALNLAAAKALKSVRDSLVICGAVYAELLAWPGRTEEFLDNFFPKLRSASSGRLTKKSGARAAMHSPNTQLDAERPDPGNLAAYLPIL